MQGVAAEPHRVREFVKPGCVWVLDEVWRLFPQGQHANRVPDDFKSLLAEHRHMLDAAGQSVRIVLGVQDLAILELSRAVWWKRPSCTPSSG